MMFEDRQDAGKQLAYALKSLQKQQPVIVALPRGGVSIGFELGQLLHSPVTVLVVRKITTPVRPELGVGAIAEGNIQVFDTQLLTTLEVSKKSLEEALGKERKELTRRIQLYRHNQPLPNLKGRTVIVVDDGLATGVTAQAAIFSLKKQQPKHLIFAAPVCAHDTAGEMEQLVDSLMCLTMPIHFEAVGSAYRSFEQVTDEEVIDLLRQAEQFTSGSQVQAI